MKPMKPLSAFALLTWLAATPAAGDLLEDVRGAVRDAGGVIRDTKDTKHEIEGTVGEGKDLVGEGTDLIPATEWYAAQGRNKVKMDEDQLRAKIAGGELDASTLVWTKGMAEWQPAGDVPALQSAFESAPPPLPDVASDEPPPLP